MEYTIPVMADGKEWDLKSFVSVTVVIIKNKALEWLVAATRVLPITEAFRRRFRMIEYNTSSNISDSQ